MCIDEWSRGESNSRPGSREVSSDKGLGAVGKQGAAESAAVDEPDADLHALIEVWPTLPPAMRAGIMVMAKAAAAMLKIG